MPLNYNIYDLKKLRNDHAISQKELSGLLKVVRSRLSRIENFKERLTFQQEFLLKENFSNYNNYLVNQDTISKPDETNLNIESSDRTNADLILIEQLKSENKSLKELIVLYKDLLEIKETKKTEVTSNEALTLTTHNEKGEFVNWDQIVIPSDQYIEMKPGVLLRKVNHSTDIINKDEAVFIPNLGKLNFDEYSIVILNSGKKDTSFDLHYHIEEEILIVVKGMIFDNVSKAIVKKGEQILNPSMQEHHYMYLEDTLLIALIKK